MPNCFQLTNKATGIVTPLNQVDRELCQFLNQPVHERYYVANWFNTIGQMIAVKGLHLGDEKLRATLIEWYEGASNLDDMMKCLDYLETNYISDSWVEIGRKRD